MITKREAAIISAYTGFMLGEFWEMHKYAEELMERPVFTHEFVGKEFFNELKERSKKDFINLEIEREEI